MELALYGSVAWRHPGGFFQVLDWAAAHGWQQVDARGMSLDIVGPLDTRLNAFGYDMLGPKQIRGSARADLRAALAARGLQLSGIYCSSPANLPGTTGAQCRLLIRRYLELASELGASWVRPINNTRNLLPEFPLTAAEAWERTVAGLLEIAPYAAELEIGLLLENNENTVTSDAETLLAMRAELSGACRVGIAYDGANAYFQGLDPATELAQLAGRIDVLHLKNVKRHQVSRWSYMPRGDFSYEWTTLAGGDLDWTALVRTAADGGFDGPLVYEYVNPFKGMPLEYWDTLPEPAEAAAREGQFLRDLISAVSAKS